MLEGRLRRVGYLSLGMPGAKQEVIAPVSTLSLILQRVKARVHVPKDKTGFVVARCMDGGPVFISRRTSKPAQLLIDLQISHAVKVIGKAYTVSQRGYDSMLLALAPHEIEGRPGWYDSDVCGAPVLGRSEGPALIVRQRSFKAAANPFRTGTWQHAAHEVLGASHVPLRNQEISRYVLDLGLMTSTAARPHASMSRALLNGKRAGHFEYVDRLRKWQLPGQFEKRAAAPGPPRLAPAAQALAGLDPAACSGSGVYLIEDTARGSLKIGHAVNLSPRFATLQSMTAHELRIVGWIETLVPIMLERELHRVFGHGDGRQRSAWLRGEWFDAQRVMGLLGPVLVEAEDSLTFVLRLRELAQTSRKAEGKILLADDVAA